MITVLKIMVAVGALVPAAALAHCCCDGHHKTRLREHASYRAERELDWDRARFHVTAARPCHYPSYAAGASGVTVVKLHVDEDGTVDGVRLADSSGTRALDRAALACVSGWHLGGGYEWRIARVVWRWHWVSWG